MGELIEKREADSTIIAGPGFGTGDILLILVNIGGTALIFAWGGLHGTSLAAIFIIMMLNLYADGKRWMGRPYLKLTPDGLIDSRLDKTLLLNWYRMQAPQYRSLEVVEKQGVSPKPFFSFTLIAPTGTSASNELPQIQRYLKKHRLDYTPYCSAYPIRVCIPLAPFQMPPDVIAELLTARIEAAHQF